ncbi:MAG: molecular chaperone TorD family protein [Candidatus Binatia bacterium]
MKKRRVGMARIAEAAEWRLLGLLFERPHATWREEVAALAREVGDTEIRAAAEAARDATEGDHLALLGPGGAVSPREVTYCSFADPGRVLADLAAFYEAFGFHPCAEDPIDHVAVETGFVGYLLLKEEFARAHGDRGAAEATVAARHHFLETHLALLAGPFAERLGACGPSYVACAAGLLAARVPKTRPAAPEPDTPGGCGACSFSGASDEGGS